MKTIRLRFVIPAILCGFSGMVALSLTLDRVYDAQQSALAHAEETILALMPQIQESVTFNIQNDNIARVKQKIAFVALDPNVVSLLVADDRDYVIYASEYEWQNSQAAAVSSYNPRIAGTVIRNFLSQVVPEQKTMRISGYYPITIGTEKGQIRPTRRGVLFMEYDFSRMLSKQRANAYRDAFRLTLASFLLAGIMAVSLHFLVTLPVERLSRTVRELSNGNLNARARMSGRDELGQLAEAFDKMADQLAADVEARKHAAEALAMAKESAETANKTKDQFLAMLSHELRTPLTPVLASVTAIQADAHTPETLRDDLAIAHRNVETEVKLIDQLLDLTMISRRKLQLSFEVIDVHTCLENTLEICRSEIAAKHLQVFTHLSAGERCVWADSARLQQVFWNLLKNAVKFTPAGGRIDICTTSENARLRVEFTDTGVGIKPEVLSRIFNVFEQGEEEKQRRFGGLGLGLSIAKAIVEMHNGMITAFSGGKDQGATFRVELPAVTPVAQPARPTPSVTDRTSLPLRILLVDDHFDTLRILARMLRKWGHTVFTASSVMNALEVAAANPFDLLISDLGLPDGSGLDLMRQLKGRMNIRGIALSGYGTNEDIQQSLSAGFEVHVVKPVSAESLQRTLQEIAAQLVGN